MAFFKLFCSLSTSSSKGWVFSFVPVNDLFFGDQTEFLFCFPLNNRQVYVMIGVKYQNENKVCDIVQVALNLREISAPTRVKFFFL